MKQKVKRLFKVEKIVATMLIQNFRLTLLLLYSPAQQKHTFTLLYSFLPHHTEFVYIGTAYYARRYRIVSWERDQKKIALFCTRKASVTVVGIQN